MATGVAALGLVGHAQERGSPTVVVGGRETPVREAIRLSLPATGVRFVSVDSHGVEPSDLFPAGHVVLETSGLPTTAALAVLGKILDRERDGRFRGQLQVLVCEHPGRVRSDRPAGGLRPVTVEPRTAGSPPRLQSSRPVRVWVPVLSEGGGDELAMLYRHLLPEKVCPVLPFPARNPRRPDDLVLEHRELLFDHIGVSLGDLVHAHESDPFDLYRTLAALQARHAESFRGLGPSEVVVSPGHAKLPALGAFLAAYELGFPLLWASRDTVPDSPGDDVPDGSVDADLACVWLAGDPYRPPGSPPS